MVNKRLRLGLVVLLVAALGGAVWLFLPPREPRYEGKPLSFWLGELTIENDSELPSEDPTTETNRRKTQAANAIRAMGTNALPALLDCLAGPPPPSRFRAAIEKLLAKQSWVGINLPELPPDQSWQSVRAFQVLGPVAEPAMPVLAKMLEDEQRSSVAAACLTAIGSASVPALLNAVTNDSERVQGVALLALGNLGATASAAIPLLERIISDRKSLHGDNALRVLSEVAEPTESRIVLYGGQLHHPDRVFGAAFALGRSAPKALPMLLQTLTNQNRTMRIAGLAALQPEIRPDRPTPSDSSRERDFFNRLVCIYNLKALSASFKFYAVNETAAIASTLAQRLDDTNVLTRASIVDLLAQQGLDGVVGLSKARADENAGIQARAAERLKALGVEVREGGIIRGSQAAKHLALVFTGHEFAEGGESILNELKRHRAQGSFFLTGDFLANPEFTPLVGRMIEEGHYVGPHSDRHLLYCSWERPPKLLVNWKQFASDLAENRQKITRWYNKPTSADEDPHMFAVPQPMSPVPEPKIKYFLPPYEHYNLQIAQWTAEMNMRLINFTPGTRSNADYTGEADKNFVSSQAIFDSILKKEREDPHGLNGFILLLHLGAGPGRQDKFHHRFGELLDTLAAKGYQFVRIDQLLEPNFAP